MEGRKGVTALPCIEWLWALLEIDEGIADE